MDLDIANFVIALYGAVVATASAFAAVILGMIELRRGKPELKVRISTLQSFDSKTERISRRYVSVRVANAGTRPLTITSQGFITHQGNYLVILEYLPPAFVLEDGQSKDILYPVAIFADESFFKDVAAVWVADGTGKSWKTQITRRHKRVILEMVREERLAGNKNPAST